MKVVRFLALGLTLAAAPALAQQGYPPPGAVAQPQGAGPTCMQLEGALAQIDRGPDPNDARIRQAAQMRADLDRLSQQARSMQCDAPRGFFIFQGPPRPPACDDIDRQISNIRSSLATVERSGVDTQGQRRQIILALAQNNCGPQYRAAAQAMTTPSAGQRPARPRNFFEALFGGPVDSEPEEAPGLDVAPMDLPKSSTFRTVCVRTCDGFYFPISYATVPARFATDDALCRRLCPAAEAQLFTYRNPGEDIQQATNISGKPYMSLPTALLYRKQLVPTCSCRAPGQSWSQALSGLEDQSTLQKGDILVTEEQAKEMSQPRPAEVPQQAKGRAASTAAKPASATDAPPSATAPMAPAAEQPGQRPVRVISTPKPPAPVQ
ncbi:DUF2865 domain-containing protein [Aquabacter sp. CN5-332]|uniref:DUF2865 domain-containing protein n=1 Tax=Aquabacter sp. CN5-332 TaxID=3156608 RepID=UPI0032B60D45